MKVSFIGSGNWGTAAASIAAQNLLRHNDFDDQLRMYVHEESVPGPDEGTFKRTITVCAYIYEL